MACCKICCGCSDCAEGQSGKCCCGGSGGSCCTTSQVCCAGSCCDNECCDGVCCEDGDSCCGQTCCPEGRVCCDDVCCPEHHRCVDGECEECPDGETPCGEECCTQEQTCCDSECCDDVCCVGVCCLPGEICCDGLCKTPPCDSTPCTGPEDCPNGNNCCNGECCDLQGCDWYTTCVPADPDPAFPITTLCGQYTAGAYQSPAPYNQCGFENNGQRFVDQTIDFSPLSGIVDPQFFDLPYGIEWQAGYPAALAGCPWAVVTDFAGSACCRTLDEAPFFQGANDFSRRVRLLRASCDGTLQDVTAIALTGSGACWGRTDIDRITTWCEDDPTLICNSPENPPFLPFFPDPVFACPP